MRDQMVIQRPFLHDLATGQVDENGIILHAAAWHRMLLVFAAPCQLCGWAGQEHGGSIPLTEVEHSILLWRRSPLSIKECVSCCSRPTSGGASSSSYSAARLQLGHLPRRRSNPSGCGSSAC